MPKTKERIELELGAGRTATLYPIEHGGFDHITVMAQGYVIVSIRERGLGLIDRRGRTILEPVWEGVHPYQDDGVIIARRGGTSVLFDFEGKTLTGLPVDELLASGGAALIGRDGKIVRVESVGDFIGGIARVKTAKGIGYADAKGRFIMDAPHKLCGDFHDSRALFEKNNGLFKPKTYGYITPRGDEVIKPVYENATPFSEGFAVVTSGKERTYIDKTGKPLECYMIKDSKRVPLPKLYDMGLFCNGYARVITLGKSRLLPAGDGLWQPVWDGDGGWGLISKTGELTVPMQYNEISDVNKNGIGIYSHRKGWMGLLRADGRVLLKDVFTQIREHSGGVFALETQGKWMAADREGRLIGTQSFDQIGRFAADGVCVQRDGKWGMIGWNAELLMPFEFDKDFCLQRGAALVKREGEYFLCGRDAKPLHEIRFEDGLIVAAGLALVAHQGKRYVLDFGYDAQEKD